MTSVQSPGTAPTSSAVTQTDNTRGWLAIVTPTYWRVSRGCPPCGKDLNDLKDVKDTGNWEAVEMRGHVSGGQPRLARFFGYGKDTSWPRGICVKRCVGDVGAVPGDCTDDINRNPDGQPPWLAGDRDPDLLAC